jgi:hypothetical protein
MRIVSEWKTLTRFLIGLKVASHSLQAKGNGIEEFGITKTGPLQRYFAQDSRPS